MRGWPNGLVGHCWKWISSTGICHFFLLPKAGIHGKFTNVQTRIQVSCCLTVWTYILGIIFPIKRTTTKRAMLLAPVAHTCNPSYSKAKIRRTEVWGQPGQIVSETLSQKYPTGKKGWWSGSSGRVPASQAWTPVPHTKKNIEDFEVFFFK
jgi:hypothetical protein